jgi:tetratricopeptide (TPR) repeat protein
MIEPAMTETARANDLLHQLQAATDPAEKAALVAEFAFAQLPAPTALVARRCIILRWFDAAIVAALLPGAGDGRQDADQAATVFQQLTALPFVEHLPWGWAYHDLTRSGLLARYATAQPALLQEAAQLAAPAYAQHEHQQSAALEALYCMALSGDPQATTALFEQLLLERVGREEWDGVLALFATLDQAAALPLPRPLAWTALHWFARAVAQQKLGDLAGAIADYEQALALNPQHAAAYYNRGTARQDQGDLARAIADYEQAIALNPQYAAAYNNRGTARQDQGDLARAIADYTQAFTLNPQDAAAYYNRGTARQDQGDLVGAITDYEQALALNPQYVDAYNNRGTARQDQGDLAGAIADYTQALTLNPQDVAAYNNRGTARQDQGDLAGAIADYEQALALNPQDAGVYYNRGNARRTQGDLAGAIADYEQALALNPTNWSGWLGLASLARHQGDEVRWREALSHAQSLAKPTDLYNMACLESVAGNTEAALAFLAQAAEEGDVDPAWAALDPDLEWVRSDPRFAAILQRTTSQ